MTAVAYHHPVILLNQATRLLGKGPILLLIESHATCTKLVDNVGLQNNFYIN